MYNRRKFLQQAGTVAAGSFLLPYSGSAGSFFKPFAQKNIGIQLYTLSQLMTEDPIGTLQKVADIGYKELETAATPKGYYYGYKPKEFASIVKDKGMNWRSQHVMGAPFDISKMQQAAKQMNGQDTAK